MTRSGFLDAITNPDQIGLWWRQWPRANVGIACGGPLGLLVIDVDVGKHDGTAALRELEERYVPLPRTVEVRTPTGGRHLYYSHSERVGNSAGKLGKGIDVRGHGGYVIAPPSVHPNGGAYEWAADNPPRPASAPAWLIRRLDPTVRRPHLRVAGPITSTNGYGRAALHSECAAVLRTAEGGRNDRLNRAAFNLGQLVRHGYVSADDARDQLLEAAVAAGLTTGEAERTIASGLDAGIRNPRDGRLVRPPSPSAA